MAIDKIVMLAIRIFHQFTVRQQLGDVPGRCGVGITVLAAAPHQRGGLYGLRNSDQFQARQVVEERKVLAERRQFSQRANLLVAIVTRGIGALGVQQTHGFVDLGAIALGMDCIMRSTSRSYWLLITPSSLRKYAPLSSSKVRQAPWLAAKSAKGAEEQ